MIKVKEYDIYNIKKVSKYLEKIYPNAKSMKVNYRQVDNKIEIEVVLK